MHNELLMRELVCAQRLLCIDFSFVGDCKNNTLMILSCCEAFGIVHVKICVYVDFWFSYDEFCFG